MNNLLKTSPFFIFLAVMMICSMVAFAAPANYSLFGDASLISPGNNSVTAARLNSEGSLPDPTYGGVNLSIPEGLTFANFDTLSADYYITAGDCGGGSPRFQVNVKDPNKGNASKNIVADIGPLPNYTGCTTNTWVNSGNLLDSTKLIDTSQVGGTFYDSYSTALANYGTYEVTGIQLVVDGAWAVSPTVQTILVDNIVVNNSTATFESANSCKNDRWRSPLMPQVFKNQGECVSYYAKGGQ